MIKKLLVAIMIALPSMVFAQKFGTVDTGAILPELPDFKTAQTEFEAASKKYEDEFKNLQTTAQKQMEEYQKALDEKAPKAILDRRVSELQQFDQKMQEFRQQAAQDLEKQQQQLMAPIQQKIINAINKVGADGGYTMIFEKGQAIYTGTTVTDITPLVKAQLGLK